MNTGPFSAAFLARLVSWLKARLERVVMGIPDLCSNVSTYGAGWRQVVLNLPQLALTPWIMSLYICHSSLSGGTGVMV